MFGVRRVINCQKPVQIQDVNHPTGMSPIPKDGCRSKRKKYQNKIIANLVLLTSKVRQNQYFRCKAEGGARVI